MNITKIITELKSERDRLDEAIAAIKGIDSTGRRRGRPSKALREDRGGLHWTQRPENRAKVQRIMRTALKARKAKAR
jgi:hypothetical protein